jgi:hypothetical protein
MVERAGTGDRPDLAALSDVSNALLFAPASEREENCLPFLTQSSPAETYVLVVTYDNTAREWIGWWNTYTDESPALGGIVSAGQTADEIGAESTEESPGQSQEVVLDDVWSVTAVEDPADLTGVGIEMSGLLSKLTEAAGTGEGESEVLTEISGEAGSGPRIVVCFDSLTALLDHTDLERAFRFLHVATGRVRSGDALGYYHIDPEKHDAETLATLRTLFDGVLDDGEDGWAVET